MAGDIGIGRIIEGEAFRDAIHVAVAPVVSDEKLWPGQRVGLVGDKASLTTTSFIGIVDPFLTNAVYPGTRFYLFLFPGSITSLRHEWTHPAFDSSGSITSPDIGASRKWIEDFAERLGGDDYGPMTFERVMTGADEWVAYEGYLTEQGGENWRDLPSETMAEFWHHYEVVRGKKVKDPTANFFSCSC